MSSRKFIYPPYSPRVPPFGSRKYPCAKDPKYKYFLDSISQKYNTHKKTLPAGTTLYRATLYENSLYNPHSTEPVFFGLDVLISTWILSENYHSIKKSEPNRPQIGYLYVFKLKRDLPYEYISELDCTPLNKPHSDICFEKPCVHPQVILHTGVGLDDRVELGTEITIPRDLVNDDLLKHVNTYKVDIAELITKQDKHYRNWNPTKSFTRMAKSRVLSGGKTTKVESVKQLMSEVETLSQIILTSSKKHEITKAFDSLMCLTRGECICDTCKTWDKNVYIVFELGRCLVPTRFLQLIKERHFGTKRWSYIEPLYKDLFRSIFADIDPETKEIIHSSGDIEDQACIYKISNSLKKKTIALIKSEKKTVRQ